MWNDAGGFGGELSFINRSPAPEGEEKKKDRRAENVVPVAIRQILDAGDELKIGEVVVHVVKIMGIIKNIDMKSTKITFTIDDYTGQIEAVLWLEDPTDENLPSLNTYCCIYGSYRPNPGKKQNIMVFSVQPVTDLNELTAHLLEVIDVYQNAPHFSDLQMTNLKATAMDDPKQNHLEPLGMEGMNQHGPVDPQQKMVLKVISEAANGDEENKGVDVPFITKMLGGKLSELKVREITDFLLQEGFIFSTVDDEHYTVTR